VQSALEEAHVPSKNYKFESCIKTNIDNGRMDLVMVTPIKTLWVLEFKINNKHYKENNALDQVERYKNMIDDKREKILDRYTNTDDQLWNRIGLKKHAHALLVVFDRFHDVVLEVIHIPWTIKS
jgi:hypothetical protein